MILGASVLSNYKAWLISLRSGLPARSHTEKDLRCFSGSDCCEKPCTGMHNNQLIGSSCCHEQKCTTNPIFSPLSSPSIMFLFFKSKSSVWDEFERKSCRWLCPSFSRSKKKGSDQHKMPLCLAKRVEPARIFALFHSRMTLNGFPWIHSSIWL